MLELNLRRQMGKITREERSGRSGGVAQATEREKSRGRSDVRYFCPHSVVSLLSGRQLVARLFRRVGFICA